MRRSSVLLVLFAVNFRGPEWVSSIASRRGARKVGISERVATIAHRFRDNLLR
jgi:hypothetical protein